MLAVNSGQRQNESLVSPDNHSRDLLCIGNLSSKMTRWQIFTAVALRKMPELQARPDPVEARVQSIFTSYEIAKSRLSEHELLSLNDFQAAKDKEDLWAKSALNLKIAPHNERLTYTQYLFVKQKFGDDLKDQWLLPQASYSSEQDADLAETARRCLRETLNISSGYVMLGKIPSSHYSFRYPRKIAQSTGYKGAKVFFMKANLDKPGQDMLQILDESGGVDGRIKWLTEKEAHDAVHKKYMSSFARGLFSEERVDADRVLRKVAYFSRQ